MATNKQSVRYLFSKGIPGGPTWRGYFGDEKWEGFI
jgi:hypothetical protein